MFDSKDLSQRGHREDTLSVSDSQADLSNLDRSIWQKSCPISRTGSLFSTNIKQAGRVNGVNTFIVSGHNQLKINFVRFFLLRKRMSNSMIECIRMSE